LPEHKNWCSRKGGKPPFDRLYILRRYDKRPRMPLGGRNWFRNSRGIFTRMLCGINRGLKHGK